MGKLNFYMWKNEIGHLSHTIYKINSKCIKYLNVRPEILTNTTRKHGGKVLNIGVGNDFLGMTSKAQTTKGKIDKCDCTKLKAFAQQRKQSTECRDNPWYGRKYLQTIHLKRD